MKTNKSFALMQKAVGFHQKGQLTEAENSYHEVLALDPLHADALRLLGNLYIQSRQAARAIGCYEKALAVDPRHPELLTNLGVALYSQGRVNDAVQRYQQALEFAPDYSDAINNIGAVFYASGKLEEAMVWLQRALKLNVKNARAHAALGHIFRTQKKDDEAVAHYRQALALRPDDADVLLHLGNLLRCAGQSVEACAIYQRLVQLKPDNASVQMNLGTIYHDLGQLPEALAAYETALRLQPNSAEANMNRASILVELRCPDDALAAYDPSLALGPASPDAQFGKSLALLALGEYEAGWALYETRFDRKIMQGVAPFHAKRWGGEALDGKTLLIWGEQGFGDVIQFIRYAALCKQKDARIVVMCRAPLVRLLRNCAFIDEVVTSAREADFDYHIPVMSLPHLLGTTLATVPNAVPYLSVSEEARAKWQPRFADQPGLKIGLVWAGNPRKNQLEAHVTDRQRSLRLELMKPLFEFEQVLFYNLQKDEAAREIEASGLGASLTDYMADAEDFMDTAALIENLDLVISVDTSVVHLAGALGKPVWVLSRFGGCWRWLRNQKTNPWYPTARVFGQPAPGDWQSCITQVCEALREKLADVK